MQMRKIVLGLLLAISLGASQAWAQNFQVGELVDASRDGKAWFEGKIQGFENGEYIIVLTGFSGSQNYTAAQIRALAPVNLSGKFQIGDKVQLRSNQLKTTIQDFQNGRYLVREAGGHRWYLPEDFVTAQVQQQEADQEVQRKYYATFWKDARKYETTIKTMGEAFNPQLSGYYSDVQLNATQLKQLKSELDALHQLCQSNYAGLQNPPWLSGPPANNLEQRGGDWCTIAAQRQTLLPQLVMLDVQRQVGKRQSMTDIPTDGKQTTGLEYYVGMKNGFAEFKKQLQADMQKYDQLLKSAGFSQGVDWSPLETKFNRQKERLKTAVGNRAASLLDWNGNSATAHDTGAEKLAQQMLKQREPGATIFKSGVRTPQWIVIKNSIGIPLYKYQTVVSLFANPSRYEYCVREQAIVRQDYINGKYSGPKAKHDAQVYIPCP